ncbi:hypothetical protein KFU94_68955, partial [Chloroflexi bacterium TSY]|nr:hypothetical protein [Chloroflexi bacterium TSY]
MVQSNQSTDTHNSCQRGDVNCDGQHDIVDLQLFAMAYGQRTSERTDGEALDLNKDSLIDETDLRMLRRAWRTGYSVHAFADAPTFGYAVDDAGNVFLRWQLASDPYTAPIEILRDPAPAGAPASGIGTAGIVATVQPIYDQAMAESLLGEYWETLRNGFVVDSDGNPVPLATISDVHNHVQAGEQPMLVDWLSNRDTGVAQVFAKGYFDTDFAAGTGSYQYWVRAGSELAGPIAIDTTQRTELPAVTGVDAFDAEGSIPTLEADTNELVHTRILREAHASIYVLWNLDLGLNENDPVWPNGFNVWRQECDPGPTNCLPFEQQNEYSVFPQPLPVDVHNAESIS